MKDPHICGRPQCDVDIAKFAYATNLRYVYDYSSHIRTEFSGTGQNSSNIYVSGTVMLTFPTKCEGILKVSNIELREKPIEAVANAEYTSDESIQIDNLHAKSTNFAYDIQKNDLR